MTDHEKRTREEYAWKLIEHQLGETLLGYLDDPTCTEIMANPDGSVWVETQGKGVWRLDHTMTPESRLQIIEAVASYADKVCNADDPEVGDVLPLVRARFQGYRPPASWAPGFAIRVPSRQLIPLSSWLKSECLSSEQAALLTDAIDHRRNILVAGSTGSGKTTFCNALLARLEESDHRILTIEDTPELQCKARNLVPLYVNRQGNFQYQQALFIALRLRPDRIVVGELRDGLATLELLKAWNTGHGGGMATIHANNALAALFRVEQLLQEQMPRPSRTLIAEAIDHVVFLERYTDAQGKPARRVCDVATVSNTLDGNGRYHLTSCLHPSLSPQRRAQ